jgi:hypothetical protein
MTMAVASNRLGATGTAAVRMTTAAAGDDVRTTTVVEESRPVRTGWTAANARRRAARAGGAVARPM